MAEFEVIQKYFNFSQTDKVKSAKKFQSIIKSIGDDCAIIDVPNNCYLVTSTDTLVSGVHFFPDVKADDLAYKALAVNVSDLAAMGAKPIAFTLAITLPVTLPKTDHQWLADFSQSLKQTSKNFKIPLVGGDTTQGPLSITITVYGAVKKEKAMCRNLAEVDDDIWVTGTLGDAAAGLSLHGKKRKTEQEKQLWQQLLRPHINLKFSRKLTKFSQCAIDVSDGLLADLGHIIVQSQVGAKLKVEALPISEALQNVVGLNEARQFALTGGDDYQLCFTASLKNRNKILNLAENLSVEVTRIGVIIEKGLEVHLKGEAFPITKNSWQHFSKN